MPHHNRTSWYKTLFTLIAGIILSAPGLVLANHPDDSCPDIHKSEGESITYFLRDYFTGVPIDENTIQPVNTWVRLDTLSTAYGSCTINGFDPTVNACVTVSIQERLVGGVGYQLVAETQGLNGWYSIGGVFGMNPVTGATAWYHVLDSRDTSTSSGSSIAFLSYPGNYTITVANIINTTYCQLTPDRVQKTFTLIARNPINDKDLGCNSKGVGNPCNPATGNKYQREQDYAGPALPFVRHYNSGLGMDIGLGFGWTSTYHKRVEKYADGSLRVRREDGRSVPFTLSGSSWVAAADSDFVLAQDGSGYTLTLPNGGTERYDLAGRIVYETDAAGKTTDYEYDTNGRMTRVVGPFGRALSFLYDSNGRLATLVDPANEQIEYTYDSIGNLSNVAYPDGKTRTYLYGEAAYWAFPGFTDTSLSTLQIFKLYRTDVADS